ncbi:uncharacterized protein LOC115632493 [Scaptodrosophila lebanonensis]|uniref:Uncharacterized protein LOC115632493 n=1 Tax=Drosophila lebanonensis TaxID=7225 RepID=A0A6J2UEM0_DROLE|nr:uncharacterized protein LOC115632493 [Scaptodrosophila lebanonensis]
MTFNNCTCSMDDPEKLLTHLRCGISKSIKRRTFSIEIKFSQPVTNFFINLRMVLPRRAGMDFTVFNLTDIEGCRLLSNTKQIPILQVGRIHLDHFSNLPKNCPWKPNVMYYIRGFRPNMESMPAFSFETDLNLWFDFVVNHSKIIKGFMVGHVQRRQIGKKT